MKEIYFDNSATTRVSARVAAAMVSSLTENWGNPSSVHGKGLEARRAVEASRERILRALGVKDLRSAALIFTGSGTEADNLALTGSLSRRSLRGKMRIITTDSEHPAVRNPIGEAERQGFEVVRLSTRGGLIDFEEFSRALTPETVLVSVMRVNNETGAVYPVEKLFSLAKANCPEVITHCDAVQGFLKIDCNPVRLRADLMTLSGHKIGGPKGVGALYCDASLLFHKKIRPLIFGGGQENGFRSGTENVPGILGMAEAVGERLEGAETEARAVLSVRAALEKALSGLPVRIHRPQGDFLPHIVSLTVPGVKSEVLVRFFSSKGICLSAGSACSSRGQAVNPVLTSFGLSAEEADSTLRISLSGANTEEEASAFAEVLREALEKLAKKR